MIDDDHEALTRAQAETYLGLIATAIDAARTDPVAWQQTCAQRQVCYGALQQRIGLPTDESLASLCRTLLALQAEPNPPTAADLVTGLAAAQAVMAAGNDRLINPRPLEEFRYGQQVSIPHFAVWLGLTVDAYRAIHHTRYATALAVQQQVCAQLAMPPHAVAEFDPWANPVVRDALIAELSAHSDSDIVYIRDGDTFVPVREADLCATIDATDAAAQEPLDGGAQ